MISRKCPVAPVSAMSGDDVVVDSIVVVGGEEAICKSKPLLLSLVFLGVCSTSIAVPRP